MTNRRARKKLLRLCIKIRHERKTDDKLCYDFIKEFMEIYGKCKPDRESERKPKHYDRYVEMIIQASLISIREGLEKKDYNWVLHEIQKMYYLGFIHRLNVKTALTDLLDKYIDEDLEAVDN